MASKEPIRYTGHAPQVLKLNHTQKERVISTKIFVGNLSFTTTEQELSEVLSAAGRLVRVHIGTDRETGRSRGFAFVEYGTEAEAADAIRRFDGHDLGGRRLRVNDADDRPPARAAAPSRPSSQAAPSFAAPQNMFAAGDPFGGGGGDAFGGGRAFKGGKGSRRNLRARKRSLGY